MHLGVFVRPAQMPGRPKPDLRPSFQMLQRYSRKAVNGLLRIKDASVRPPLPVHLLDGHPIHTLLQWI